MLPILLSIIPSRNEDGEIDEQASTISFAKELKRYVHNDLDNIRLIQSLNDVWGNRLAGLRRINLDGLTTFVLQNLKRSEKDRHSIRDQVKEIMSEMKEFAVQQDGRQTIFHCRSRYPNEKELTDALCGARRVVFQELSGDGLDA